MEPKLPQPNSKELSSATDEALFVALKNGDSSALSILFNRHGRLVYGLALKILANSQEAEDLTQEIFLTLWRKASSNPDCRFFVRYLVTVTRSRAIDKLRDRHRQLKLVERWGQTMSSQATPSPTPVEQATFAERSGRIYNALKQLPEKQRQVIELAYNQGLSQSEIAKQIDIPLGTVKTCTRQGLLKLKRILLDSDLSIYE
ncbi:MULTISPECIES: sigma-70 family RNA polymerase sigma factor [unclassified Nodularia (in: cyanobacteria)]|uniref:sigma-70 family RNA polymerase sigma factor n=1 Tax=unclassified Nodularia (in: cyanobacteria) TaxID=2656917 RepID=UPI00187E05D0|nr:MULTISPECIES: sigma-70 family RNA polymerase sigma factor [unclassified Nodularia (in: cyanobacteria)]MBE9201520.1 sigma-70 family RNA polymerase sigma factor [Nodularia sp. LEGE 06071]MCC2694411.1 sigma-70 family RNA polymerase sigma factor [Nodularia sp. LEGE 04288]